jgi:small subunit ribosomal protein S1
LVLIIMRFFVDIGYKSDGVISSVEFAEADPDWKENLTVGQEIEVYIARVNDVEGIVVLSRKKAEAMKAWVLLEEMDRDKEILMVKVSQVVKGGLIAQWKGIRIFVPASQISNRFVGNLEAYLGSTLRIRLIDYQPHKKKVVGSQRVVLQEEKKVVQSDVWKDIEKEKEYLGVVKSLTSFGAFVDIGGVDGLIHISDLSWGKIGHPSEVLQEGQEVRVLVKDVDKEKKKISFNLKDKGEDPWALKASQLSLEQVVEAKVLRLVPFGAFVEIFPGVEGLVHISKISEKRLSRPQEVLQEGQMVRAKIMELHLDKKKISLNMKEVDADLVKTEEVDADLVKTEEVDADLVKTEEE